MSNWLDSARDAIGGAYCSYLGVVDNYLGFWSSLGVPTDRINPELRSYVCDEPGPPLPPPPFTGGQCEGVSYTVSLTGTESNNFCSQSSYNEVIGGIIGPISNVFLASVNSDSCPNDRFNELRITANDGSGNQVTTTVRTYGQSKPENISNISVSRDDGQPDNCGDPSPEVPPLPPGGTTVPISFTYIDNSDNSVNVNADLTLYAPVFAPVGIFAPRVFVPIRINGPNFEFSGNIQLPDLNVDISPTFGQPSGGGTDSPPADQPNTPDTPTTPDDNARRVLIGVLVRSQPIGRTSTTELLQPTGPNLYVPRLANVYFRVRMGRTLSWLGPYDVKTRDAFVPVPPDVVAIAARVDGEPGWLVFGTQVYRSTPPEPSE